MADDVLRFLLASRYCEVDSELKDLAWTLFGQTLSGWPRVQAICDFVHQHLRFDSMAARATRTALARLQTHLAEHNIYKSTQTTLA